MGWEPEEGMSAAAMSWVAAGGLRSTAAGTRGHDGSAVHDCLNTQLAAATAAAAAAA